jgi:hypothetical protein
MIDIVKLDNLIVTDDVYQLVLADMKKETDTTTAQYKNLQGLGALRLSYLLSQATQTV